MAKRRKELTDRQRQAYELRAKGKTLKDIAAIMGATREPVRKWIAAARRKLGLPPESWQDITR